MVSVIDESAKSIAVIISAIAFVVLVAKVLSLALQSAARLVVAWLHEREEQTETPAQSDAAAQARAKAAGDR